MLREPKRKLVDRAGAAALEFELNLAHGHRSIARLQNALIESDLDRSGRQRDDARVPMDTCASVSGP
jgi:hypothetical protein